MGASGRWVELGRLGGAYGVRGWIHVQSYTDPPEGLLDYEVWLLRGRDGSRIERRLLEGRPHGKGLVVRLEGVADREAAAALSGSTVEVGREALPEAGPREHYRADLVGLRVRNLEGEELGEVAHFVDAPASVVMVVRGEREHWVPAAPPHLVKVDREAGWIQVDWPADL